MSQPFNTAVIGAAGAQAIDYNPNGTVNTITKTFPGGFVFIKTFTYVDAKVTNITDLVLQ